MYTTITSDIVAVAKNMVTRAALVPLREARFSHRAEQARRERAQGTETKEQCFARLVMSDHEGQLSTPIRDTASLLPPSAPRTDRAHRRLRESARSKIGEPVAALAAACVKQHRGLTHNEALAAVLEHNPLLAQAYRQEQSEQTGGAA
jgi:hypothetical protein